MKRSVFLSTVVCCALAVAVTMALFSEGAWAGQEKVFKVGVTQIVTHPALDAMRTGFVKTMAEKGFVEGKNIEYDFLNPEGDMSVAKTIADKFVSEPKDLIVTLTTPCTQAACAAAEGKDVPIVFIAVTDPVLAGVVKSWEQPCHRGVHITGTSDYVPVRPQLEIIRQICPQAKVLGAVYNPGDESNTKTVNEMKRLAPEFGLEYTEAGVSTTAEVRNAGMSLVGRADLMWFPLCNTTAAGLEALVSVCEEHDIPLFPPDYDSVKRGGIATIYYSNEELGQLGAEQAAKVLRGAEPCDLPVQTFTTIRIYVNPGAAGRMGTTIPQSLMDRAYEIIK